MNNPDDNANTITDEAFEGVTVEHDIATGDQRLAESADEPFAEYPHVDLLVEQIGPMQRIIGVLIDGKEFQVPGDSEIKLRAGPGPTSLVVELFVGSVLTKVVDRDPGGPVHAGRDGVGDVVGDGEAQADG